MQASHNENRVDAEGKGTNGIIFRRSNLLSENRGRGAVEKTGFAASFCYEESLPQSAKISSDRISSIGY